MTPEAIPAQRPRRRRSQDAGHAQRVGRDAAAGKSGAEMTEWVRSMERPLLNSKAFLDEE